MGKWRKRALRFAIAVGVGLGMTEFVIRVWPSSDDDGSGSYRGYPGGLFAPHERRAFWYVSGFRGTFRGRLYAGVPLSIDEHGFRTVPQRVSGGESIALLGDSVTFGPGVADDRTFAAQLAGALSADVIHGGVNSYGLEQLLDLARSEILPRGVHTLVLVFNLNDLEPTQLPAYVERAFADRGVPRAIDGIAREPRPVAEERGAFEGFVRHSALVDRLWTLWERERVRSGAVRSLTERYYEAILERWSGEEGVRATGWLRELARSARAAGTELLVVFPPYAYQWDLDPEAPELSPQLLVGEACRAEEIPFFDLRERMAAHPHRESLLLPNDPQHLSDAGHAWMADVLVELLARPR